MSDHISTTLGFSDQCHTPSVRSRGVASRRRIDWSKVDKNGPIPEYRPALGPCWLWLGALNRFGYGPHRKVWELTVGPVAEGLQLDHLCRVRSCVRPEHLEPVTPLENIRRSIGNPTMANAAATHCPKGHAYDAANTYVTKDGRRDCRACNRERQRRYVAKRLASHEIHVPAGSRGHTKLTEAQVADIKAALGQEATLAGLASRYEVSPSTIASIRRGLTWRHVVTNPLS